MKKQRSIVLFLVKFFAAYFILFTVYSLYLHHTQKKDELYSCSPINKQHGYLLDDFLISSEKMSKFDK